MPDLQRLRLDLTDLTLIDATGEPTCLSQLTGVNVLVMLRHRH